ncbi:MAG: hypothetical protein ABMB14_32445 [Myxococcota bacterium]
MDWTGANPGCHAVTLDETHFWTIKVDRVAVVNGNVIEVQTETGNTVTTTVQPGAFKPVAGHTYSFANGDTWTRVGPSNLWATTGNGSGGVYPEQMLHDAAVANGLGGTWDANAADNGVDR